MTLFYYLVPMLLSASFFGAVAQAEILPDRVYLKTDAQTFTSRWDFALAGGRIWFKAVAADATSWELLDLNGLPAGLVGENVARLSADGDSLMAVLDDGRLYDAELSNDSRSDRVVEKWNDGFGWPLRAAAKKVFLPKDGRAWAGSVLDTDNGSYYEDPAGTPHRILGINTLYVLSADGREVRFDDPWLPPNDFEFRFTAPGRGKIPAVSLSASGSTVFVISKTGRLFTRLIDFDTLGGNPGISYSYTATHKNYQPEGFWADLRTHLPFLLDERKLPGEDWREQPAIETGDLSRTLTRRITILQTGKGNAARELRVAGADHGRWGYFAKGIFEKDWRFTETGEAVPAAEWLDPASAPEPALEVGESHAGLALFATPEWLPPGPHLAAHLTGFNTDFDPARLTIFMGRGKSFDLLLYQQAGIFPVRAGQANSIDGALVVPPETRAMTDRDIRILLGDYLWGRDAYPVKVVVSDDMIEVRSPGFHSRSGGTSRENSFVFQFKRK